MSALIIGGIVFACVFGGALFGMFLGTVLPKDHLSPDARDVIKVTMAMIAMLAALVLGLLTASAKSSLDDKESELRSAAAQVILLDRTMAEYGAETEEARDLLKQTLAARISQIWPEENATVTLGALGIALLALGLACMALIGLELLTFRGQRMATKSVASRGARRYAPPILLAGTCCYCRLDLPFHRLEIEARALLHRRELDEALGCLPNLLLYEDEAPELVQEPVVISE
jgi:hypothetical protein